MPDKILDTFINAPWNKFFRTNFIKEKDIRFQCLFRSNDIYFVFLSLVSASKISLIYKSLVYYRRGMKDNSQATNHLYPLNFYESDIAFRDRVLNLEYYSDIEKGLLVRVLKTAIYNLDSQKTLMGFKSVYEHLVKNLNKDFPILENEDYFLQQVPYIASCYNDYKLMLETPVDEYLAIKGKYFIDEEDTSVKVSVIIPVYNTEKYLRECLDSIVNQTLENIEIICINDGSTDNSINILKEYADRDKRITVISQRNQGQAVARNKGISMSSGKYIYFMDSDDKLVLYALDLLFTEAVTNNLDVVYFDAISFFETIDLEKKYPQYKTMYQSKFNKNCVMSGCDMFVLMNKTGSYRASPCLFIVKTEFIKTHEIYFPEGILYEDNLFMFNVTLSARCVKHMKEKLFLRRVRYGSTKTQNATINHLRGYLICYIKMSEFANNLECPKEVSDSVSNRINSIKKNMIREYERMSQMEKDKIKMLDISEKENFDKLVCSKC